MNAFHGQQIIIVGGSGGLGSAIAHSMVDAGGSVLLVGRTLESLQQVAKALGEPAQIWQADLTDADSLAALAKSHPQPDVVINATGYDVRKPFLRHTTEDMRNLLEINLLGAMQLTHAFLPGMLARRSGSIVHLGGFADGRLAFPYYSADAASRAGLRTFLESLNREIAGHGVTLTYFSPAPADTLAERPFHPIWREMGTPILPPQQIAAAVLDAIQRNESVRIMGIGARLLAAVNVISPALADHLAMRSMSRVLAKYFGP